MCCVWALSLLLSLSCSLSCALSLSPLLSSACHTLFLSSNLITSRCPSCLFPYVALLPPLPLSSPVLLLRFPASLPLRSHHRKWKSSVAHHSRTPCRKWTLVTLFHQVPLAPATPSRNRSHFILSSLWYCVSECVCGEQHFNTLVSLLTLTVSASCENITCICNWSVPC